MKGKIFVTVGEFLFENVCEFFHPFGIRHYFRVLYFEKKSEKNVAALKDQQQYAIEVVFEQKKS